jgi:hypothetical protein
MYSNDSLAKLIMWCEYYLNMVRVVKSMVSLVIPLAAGNYYGHSSFLLAAQQLYNIRIT